MAATRRPHYVSRFFLKAWAEAGALVEYDYDTHRARDRGPKQVGMSRTYVAGSLVDRFEALWQPYESRAGDVLAALRESSTPTAEHADALRDLIAVHLARQIRRRGIWDALCAESPELTALRHTGLAGLRQLYRELTGNDATGAEDEQSARTFIEQYIKKNEEVAFVTQIGGHFDKLRALLANTACEIRSWAQPTEVYVSDTPVVLFRFIDGTPVPSDPFKFGVADGALMPLGPRTAVALLPPQLSQRFVFPSPEHINSMQARQAVRYLYCRPGARERLLAEAEVLRTGSTRGRPDRPRGGPPAAEGTAYSFPAPRSVSLSAPTTSPARP